MEWAIEKCTELGATRIVPVIANRTEAHLAAAAPKRVERWQRIALQAAEQSRRNSPPKIDQPMKLNAAVALPGAVRIVLAESEQQTTLREVLHDHLTRDIILAFGPEGGWTESEFELFRDAGWISVSLGNTILRVETAAIAALAVTLSELA
jgi:16S rRNA (uracil1498-N3)-methyltransferase